MRQHVRNPRDIYFDEFRYYYETKFQREAKRQITVRPFLNVLDDNDEEMEVEYLNDMSMDIIQTNQGCVPIVKTFEHNAYWKNSMLHDVQK